MKRKPDSEVAARSLYAELRQRGMSPGDIVGVATSLIGQVSDEIRARKSRADDRAARPLIRGRRVAAERRVAALRAGDGSRQDVVRAVLEDYGPEVIGFLFTVLADEDIARQAYVAFCEVLPDALAASDQLGLRARVYRAAVRAARGRAGESSRSPTAGTTSPYAATIASFRAQLSAHERALLCLHVDREIPVAELSAIVEIDPQLLSGHLRHIQDQLIELADRAGLVRA